MLMKAAGRIVALVFEDIKDKIKPGVSTMDISNWCDQIIRSQNAYPTFLNYGGFPAAACVSVNEELVHGIPSKNKILKEGDIVSVDVGATLNGYVSDACRTFPVGNVSDEAKKLMQVTKESFFKACEVIKPGIRLGLVSSTIQKYNEAHGYSLPREFTGHGIGTSLHEDPYIPNYGKESDGIILKEGMCLAIEPMVASGKHYVRIAKNGWTAIMKDGKISSHYENSIVVTKDGYEILTKL